MMFLRRGTLFISFSLIFLVSRFYASENKTSEQSQERKSVTKFKKENKTQRAPLPKDAVIQELPRDGGVEFNRLIFENSPYLLQHARNPIDFYADVITVH